ncbi:MAG TPA: hypothetical protein VEB42_02895 [Chitinophagaceae bacterium]|nr:hypothetical protein [Chitinophagaceae bacterium]
MVNVKAINDERMTAWKTRLNRVHSTPVLLIGIGHDHNSGQMHVIATEDMTKEHIVLFLRSALEQLTK